MDFFGRKTETEKLTRAFERVQKGQSGTVLVTGPPGVGKSALVHRFALGVESAGGMFVFGKADLNRSATPFGAVGPALDMVVKKRIAEAPEAAREMALTVARRMGGDLGRVVALLPSLSYLLPEADEKPVPAGHGRQAAPILIHSLLEILTRPDRGLVLFLDDIQWLDGAGLALLAHLCVAPPIPGLLLVLGFRGLAYTTAPKMAEIEKGLREADGALTLALKGLGRREIAAWLKQRLRPCGNTAPLAALCHEKTLGNPLYLIRFVADLEAGGDIHKTAEGWRWHEERIRARPVSENVVDLIVSRLGSVSENTLAILKYGALMQGEMTPEKLAMSTGLFLEESDALLAAPLALGLVEKQGEGYGFTHDRIREAVCSLISPREAAEIHYRLMTHCLAAVRQTRTPDRLFPLLYHFERCGGHGHDDVLKKEMARYYVAAAQAAHLQSAYDQALAWYLKARSLFPEGLWHDDPARAWEICRYGAESACLTGDFGAADRLFDEAEAHAPDPDARFDMEMVKIASLQARDAHEAALALGRRMLARLGHALPERISAMKLAWAIFRVWGRCRGAMGQQDATAPSGAGGPDARVLQVLLPLGPTTTYINRKKLFAYIVAKGLELSLRWGNTGESPMFYLAFGIILNRLTGSAKWGRRMADTAERIRQQYPDEKHKARELIVAASYLAHWDQDLVQIQAAYRTGQELCRKQGDHVYYAYNAASLLNARLLSGSALAVVLQEARETVKVVRKMKNAFGISVISALIRLLTELCTGGEAPWETGERPDTGAAYAGSEESWRTDRAYQLCYRFCGAFFSGRSDLAMPMTDEIWQLPASHALFNYMRFLGVLAAIDGGERPWKIRRRLGVLKRYARENPALYQGRWHLAAGELARVRKRPVRALKQYRFAEEHLAQERGALFETALLWEKRAIVLAALKDEAGAGRERAQAVDAYKKWGLRWRAGLFKDTPGRADQTGVVCTIAPPQAPHPPEVAGMLAILAATGARQVHAVAREAALWKSRLLVAKGVINRPATFLPLPDRMLTFADATGEVVTATAGDAKKQFFDTAYFFTHRPDSLVVLPAGRQAAVLIVDPGRPVDAEAVRLMAGPLFAWLRASVAQREVSQSEMGASAHPLMENCRRLQAHLREKKPYRDSKFGLKQLAADLEISARTITDTLNSCLGQNVQTFINSYRIEEVKEKMAAPGNADRTILELALAAGFNSKSAFNEAFRKQTGMTPSAYREAPTRPPRETRPRVPAVG